jgi:hypothetical protein
MVEFAITGKQLGKALERQRDNLTSYEEINLTNYGCLTVRSLRVIHELLPEDPNYPEEE